MATRVLLIDDDRFARQLYGDYLSAAGFDVVTAATGEEGLARLEADVEAVVTDLLLPGMDGLEVLSEVRQRAPEVGVVVITALDQVDPAVQAIKGGAFDYLVKPVSPEALQISVERCLEHRRLLQENAALRTHVSLSQAGARIAGGGRRERVLDRTARELSAHTAAASVAVVESRTDGSIFLVATAGAEQPDPWSGEAAARTGLAGLAGAPGPAPVPAPGSETAALGDGLAWGLGRDPTLAVLLFPRAGARLLEEDRRNTAFLLEHARAALATAERLESAETLAHLDDLTQLFNARFLRRHLDRLIQDATDPPTPFSLLFLDLDRFKTVNDTHGHMTGSRLLIEVGRVLRNVVRETDVTVRYGGDEFVVVLQGTTPEDAARVAERIRTRIGSRAFLSREGIGLRVTASIGISGFPTHGHDRDTLLHLADQAMYRSKEGGRDRVEVAPPPGPDS